MKNHYYKEDIIDICDGCHLTVEEIFICISEKFPDAGKSSIYRNVEELVKIGELRKVVGVGKKAYFEKDKGDHIHLIDSKTGEIMDLKEDICLPNLPKGFKVQGLDLKIFGEFSK